MKFSIRGCAVFPAIVSLAIAGCAASPEAPVTQIARAEYAIEIAKDIDAYEYASGPLSDAENTLRAARQADDEGEYEQAKKLATEAELLAQVAAAKAERAKAEHALDDINQSIAALQDEIARNSNE